MASTPDKKEDLLWESKQLEEHSPYTFLQTVWYYFNKMHFGWRGCDEHRRVCLGDFTVATDTDGIDYMYVEFSIERGTKTRTAAEWEKNRRSSKECMLLEGIDVQ